MRCILFVAGLLLTTSWLNAQEGGKESSSPNKTVRDERLDSLRAIAEPLSAASTELKKLQAELKAATSEDAKQEIQARIDVERQRTNQLRGNFRDILGGSEAAEFESKESEKQGVQDQISELIQPLLSEMHNATSEPRELDALRKELDAATDREQKADAVLQRITDLINASEDAFVISELESAKKLWTGRQSDTTGQIAVFKSQVEDRTRNKKSMWETLSTGLSRFFKSRGMNLLLAALIGIIGFIATRKVYSWLRRVSPVHRKGSENLTSRLSDIFAMALAVVVAVSGIILVFYIRGDWLLLTLAVIFLIGIAWAGKTAIPPYLEQIRMILNISSVREGERVIYNGLPWKVSKLGFFTTLTNSSIQGGLLRVPIRDIMGMISRPITNKEVWFPTEPDDWAILSDGTYGKTIVQTPDQVVLLRLGGSIKTYPVLEFLSKSPENLSHGFRISSTFGIDYTHQKDSTNSIPEIFQSALNNSLIHEYGKEQIRSIKVEFASASTSSLDYEILADFDGSLASKLNIIKRRIQKVCVDVCNEHEWVIPFTQLTIHQADIPIRK